MESWLAKFANTALILTTLLSVWFKKRFIIFILRKRESERADGESREWYRETPADSPVRAELEMGVNLRMLRS